MTLSFRRWLFASFSLIFVIMATIILPYAFGYQFNSSGLRLQRTGMFVIDTKPGGAKIFLNDKLQTTNWLWLSKQSDQYIKTPTKLSHLAPGTYRIRIELDGYWAWEKELTIKPSETTYLEDVRLFKRNLPQIVFKLPINNIKASQLSPDNKSLAIASTDAIKIFNLETRDHKSYVTNFRSRLKWSDDSSMLLLDQVIIDNKRSQITAIPNTTNGPTQIYNWTNGSSNLICFKNKSGVFQINLDNMQSQPIMLFSSRQTDSVFDCVIKGSLSYLIQQKNNRSLLSIIGVNNQKESGLIELPHTANYNFVNLNNKWLNLLDNNNKKLTLVEDYLPWSKDFSLNTLASQALLSYWIDNHRILTASENEIWLNDLDDDTQKILTRVSASITHIFWHPSKNYILYITNKNINALELDNRDRYNITELASTPDITHASLDKTGNNLYFFGKIGNQEGYWQLEL